MFVNILRSRSVAANPSIIDSIAPFIASFDPERAVTSTRINLPRFRIINRPVLKNGSEDQSFS